MPNSYTQLRAELNESFDANSFPITVAGLKNPIPYKRETMTAFNTTTDQMIARFFDAVRSIRAMADGTLIANKSMLDGWKSGVQRGIEAAVEYHANVRYLQPRHAGRDEIEEKAYYKSLNSLADAVGFLKHFEKHEKHTDYIGRKVAVAREFLPIAKIYEVAKTKVKAGRIPDPNAKPKEVNPNRVEGTCSWCMRRIALTKDQRMAHHGFERPGFGHQTASCGGINYRCVEVSDEGMKAMRDMTVNALAARKRSLSQLPSVTQLVRKNPYSGKTETHTKDSPRWDALYASEKNRLENDIRDMERQIAMLDVQIREWKPKDTIKPNAGGFR